MHLTVSLITLSLSQPVENEKEGDKKNDDAKNEAEKVKDASENKDESKTESKTIANIPDEESYDDSEEDYIYDYGETHCKNLICNTDELSPLWGINANTINKKYRVCEVFANRGCITRAACEFKRGGKKTSYCCFVAVNKCVIFFL